MAKRGAESQLTRDSRSDDEEEDNSGQTGFKRADEKTLSGRVIRGMPKRGGSTPSASPATVTNGSVPDTPTPAPRFSGFGTLPPASSAPATSAFSFTSKPFPESASSPFPPPKETSATSKMFASYLGSNPTPPASPSTGGDDGLFKYYTQLRGLNVSLEDACKNALQADPFVDLSPLFKHYTEHRATVERSRPGESISTGASSFSATNGGSAPVPASDLKLPSVPASFSFSPFPPASSSSQSASSTPVAFPSFAPPASATTFSTVSTSAPLSFSTDSPHSPPKPSKFDFSAPANNTKSAAVSDDAEKATKSTFSFGTSPASGSADSKSSTPSFSLPPASDDKGSKPGFTFGVSSTPASSADSASKSTFTFGTSSGTEPGKSSFFGDNAKSGETKPPSLFSTTTSPTNIFGGASLFSSPSGGSTLPSSESPPKTTFGAFGTSSAFGSTSSSFGGAVGGSLGNPVGFSFGSSSSKTSVAPEPPVEDSASHEDTPSDTAPEGTGLALEPSAYDKEGAGEEEEETLYEERCKAFKLDKKDGKPEWVDLGIGVFRCKKHKTTGTRRVLMRNSGSGRILLNFGIFASLKPTLQKNVVSFVAMDGSAPASFRLKVKSEAIATQLRDAIVKEVEAITKK